MNYYGHDDNKIDVVEKIMSLVGKRQYANALEFIDNLDSGDIDNPLILMSKAQCYLRLDMKKEAYDTYKETIILCNEKLNVENDPFVLNIKGNCNLILKNYIEPIECYDKVLDIDDTNTIAISFKSVALLRLDEQDAAFNCLERLLEIESSNNDIKLFKVQYLNSIERYDESLKILDEVFKDSYENPQAYMLKADALFETKRIDEALDNVNKSLEMNPKISYSWYLKAKIFMDKSDFKNALRYFDEALSIDNTVDCYFFDKASCYLNLFEYDKAYESYKKAFELNPHSGDIANADIFLDFIRDLKSVELISD